jgi:hypothetical protein
MVAVVLVIHATSLSFRVLVVDDFKDLAFSVYEVLVGVFELLEPPTICSPNLHVVASSAPLNIPRSEGIFLGLDGLGQLVKDPNLAVKSISGLDNKLVPDYVQVSSGSELGDDVEWSFNVEPIFGVEFSFLRVSWDFINVLNIPHLAALTISVLNNNLNKVSILTTFHSEYTVSVVDVDDVVALISPELVPSGVGLGNL